MAAVTSALKSTVKVVAEPLLSIGLKAVLELPVEELAGWVKSRFTDHSAALPKAIAAANDRAWQAVGLALAGDTLLGRITGLFRDGDLKAVQAQIRAFVTDADTGLDGQPAGLRARACDELNRLQRAGRLGANDVQFESLDLTRFGSTAKVADDALRAVQFIADDLKADAPHLSQVLLLAPPGGGTPLLAAAFAYFLRRQIAANPELARELTQDQLRLLSQKQQAGFANLETALGDKFDSLEATLGGWFATTDATLDEILAELKKFRDANQVATRPESPLQVSVTNEVELQRLKKLRDRLRDQPAELMDAELQSLLGDGLAAAAQYEDAAKAQAAAAEAAKESADRVAEADAAYKQFKAECELKRWDAALTALNRAVVLDAARFRPVPPHYDIEGILGAGAFGVVLMCRDRTERDDDGQFVGVAVKTFREADLDRPLEEIFAEASLLKKLSHPNVIGVHERGFADVGGQGRPFLAMEFFPGVTLEDWLGKNGRLTLPDFRVVFGQIAAGLHAAHTARRPVIHRDVKPANVMLTKAGGVWVVKVIDFGLAVKSAVRTVSRAVSRQVPEALRSTRDRCITGTIKYAAPEQMGDKPYLVGPWSDVFAFGNTALEALFGTVKPGPKHWKQLPDELTELLARCVDEEYDAKNPAEGRFHHFGPILDGLVPTPAKPVAPPPPPVAVSPVPPKPPAPKPAEVVIPLVPAVVPPPPPAPPVRKAGDRHEVTLPGGAKMAFVWCPPGTFRMGSPESEKERGTNETQRGTNETQREVRLTKGYWMGVHPVTQAQYQAVMGTNPSHWKGDTLPVENVSWEDAVAFCGALKQKTGVELRLPTEAEWEYACRAGTTTEYYSGDGEGALKSVGWFSGNAGRETHPVGQLKANAWGLHDLHGNVFEWCADWYDGAYYASSPKDDPQGPENGWLGRVCRGGSWGGLAEACRSACRGGSTPRLRSRDLGFRLAAGPSSL